MPDFSHLKNLAVTEESTSEYTFSLIEGDPSIILAPAHDVNAAFRRRRIEMSLELADKFTKPGKRTKPEKLTVDKVIKDDDEERENNRILIAHTCAKGWGTAPLDAKGKPVEFSAENCLEFLQAIPQDMFDSLARFASNLFNFYPERPLDDGDGEPLGNS